VRRFCNVCFFAVVPDGEGWGCLFFYTVSGEEA